MHVTPRLSFADNWALSVNCGIMKYLSMFPGAPRTSALGFGTTSLMGAANTKERRALLEAAFAAGIRHFDTAPYYGYGEAERLLGEFLVGKRDKVTVTTKFGIEGPAVLGVRWVNLLARRLLRLVPGIRPALSRRAQSLSPKSTFTAASARASLDRSLAALRCDHVDLFLLHEPTLADAASDEIGDFLEREVNRGRIRAYGCGGEFGAIRAIANESLPISRWLQFEDNVLQDRIGLVQDTGARCITFRIFHEAYDVLRAWLASRPERLAEWERALQVDLGSGMVLGALMQAVAHVRNPDGIVLFSSVHADRIRDAARVASACPFSPDQVERFEGLVRTEIGSAV